jgi:hypothetical protein
MKFGLTLGVLVAGLALVSVLPTCLYLYVEPRGRAMWARDAQDAANRRAPVLVRLSAWMSFVIGQLAVPWLAVPIACGVLLYLQAKLGIWKPAGMAATAAVGVMALVQAVLAFRLLPLGIRLLMRDAKAGARAGARDQFAALANASVLGATGALGWVMAHVPGLVHPWLATALGWAGVRPVMVYGAACLLHSLALGACARATQANNS